MEALIQVRLTGYNNNTINVRISLDVYGSKIRKVSICRATVSNETFLATKQEFFFTKAAPVQSITDIVLLGFWLILLPGMFISSYTTIYFFVKIFFRMFVFQWIRYSNALICFLVEKQAIHQRRTLTLLQWKLFKNDEFFSFSRYLNFRLDILFM